MVNSSAKRAALELAESIFYLHTNVVHAETLVLLKKVLKGSLVCSVIFLLNHVELIVLLASSWETFGFLYPCIHNMVCKEHSPRVNQGKFLM